jgi:hypothetical protein
VWAIWDIEASGGRVSDERWRRAAERRPSLRRARDDGLPGVHAPQAKEWVEAGEIPELAKGRRVDYVAINSGHWPMYTKPVELARILAGCTEA